MHISSDDNVYHIEVCTNRVNITRLLETEQMKNVYKFIMKEDDVATFHSVGMYRRLEHTAKQCVYLIRG